MLGVRRILALLSLFTSFSVFAATMMQAQVPVTGHSSQALSKAMPAALSQVLVKVSGNNAVMTLPAVQNALPHVSDMVKSYTYRMVSNPMDPTAAPVLMADITFDQQAVTKLLSAAGQPVWGKDRPKTLVWLDVTSANGSEQMLASANSDRSPLAVALTTDATNRGLGLIFPINDLTDQVNLTDSSNNLLNQAQVLSASKRYGAQSILAGKVVDNQGMWQAQWLYILDGAPITWSDSQTSLQALADNAINSMAANMVSQLAMASPTTGSNTVLLQVSGVDDLAEYVKVQKYLRAMKQVSSVSLKGVSQQAMTLTVSYQGSQMALRQSLNASPFLVPDVNSDAVEAADHNALGYHWQGGAG